MKRHAHEELHSRGSHLGMTIMRRIFGSSPKKQPQQQQPQQPQQTAVTTTSVLPPEFPVDATNGGITVAADASVVASASPSKSMPMQERLYRLSDRPADYPPGLALPFSRQELARIKKRFLSLVPNDSAALTLTLRDVISMPEFVGCPLIALALRTVVAKTSNALLAPTPAVLSPRQEAQALERLAVSFEQFLALLSLFSAKQSIDVKRKALFDIYDADQDGAISCSDVVKTLRAVSPATSLLTVAQLRTVVSSTLGLNDSTASLDFASFQQRFADVDVKAAMTLAF